MFTKHKILFIVWLLSSFALGAAEQKQAHEGSEFYSIVLPGLNGGGGTTFAANNVVNTPKARTCLYTTNYADADLGQDNCIAHLVQQLQADQHLNGKRKIFFCISQGTATLLNWLATKSHAEQEQEASALVLEGVLGSGNSGIIHTGSNIPVLTYLPFVRFWAPWIAKAAMFPKYNPYGKQAVKSAKNISPRIPVIIMHHTNDFQTSINDARNVYCALRENGNNNAYLLEVDNEKEIHFDVLNADGDKEFKIVCLQAIYNKHGLPCKHEILTEEIAKGVTQETLAASYQPDVNLVRRKIAASSWRQRYLRNTIDLVTAGAVACYAYLKWFKKS